MVGIVHTAPGVVGALRSISFFKIGSAEKLEPIVWPLQSSSQIHTKPGGLRVPALAPQVDCRLIGPLARISDLSGAFFSRFPAFFDVVDSDSEVAVVGSDI